MSLIKHTNKFSEIWCIIFYIFEEWLRNDFSSTTETTREIYTCVIGMWVNVAIKFIIIYLLLLEYLLYVDSIYAG